MISISVIPCLPSGLVKNNKSMSKFVLFSRLFAISNVWLFSKIGGGGGGGGTNFTPKLSNSIFLVNL